MVTSITSSNLSNLGFSLGGSCGCGPASTERSGDGHLTTSRAELSSEDAEASVERQAALTRYRERQALDERQHEQAHSAADDRHDKGGVPFALERAPDDPMPAVSDPETLDISSIADEQEAMAQAVRRAAMAPAPPSGQDRSVAVEASALEAQARMDMQMQRQEHGFGPASADQRHSLLPEENRDSGRIETRRAVRAYSAPAGQDTGSRLNLSA